MMTISSPWPSIRVSVSQLFALNRVIICVSTTIGKECGTADAIVATGQQGIGEKYCSAEECMIVIITIHSEHHVNHHHHHHHNDYHLYSHLPHNHYHHHPNTHYHHHPHHQQCSLIIIIMTIINTTIILSSSIIIYHHLSLIREHIYMGSPFTQIDFRAENEAEKYSSFRFVNWRHIYDFVSKTTTNFDSLL